MTPADFCRSDYGKLCGLTDDGRSALSAARLLVREAAKSGKIPAAYSTITFDKKGRALDAALSPSPPSVNT